jgi:hypothetical protein
MTNPPAFLDDPEFAEEADSHEMPQHEGSDPQFRFKKINKIPWSRIGPAGEFEPCTPEASFADFRQRCKQEAHPEHPAPACMWYLADRLAQKFAASKGIAFFAPTLFALLETYVESQAQRHQACMVALQAGQPIPQGEEKWFDPEVHGHWAHAFVRYDTHSSPSTYLNATLKLLWTRYTDELLTDKAKLLVNKGDFSTIELAKAHLKNEHDRGKKDFAEQKIDVIKSAPLLPMEVMMDEDCDTDTKHVTAYKGLWEEEWQKQLILGDGVGLHGHLAQIDSPLRSPMRVEALANALRGVCTTMVGLKKSARSHALRTEHCEVMLAYFGLLNNDLAVFAKPPDLKRLRENLNYEGNEDRFKEVLKAGFDIWINPPTIDARDTPAMAEHKKRFKQLCELSWSLSVPTRLTNSHAETVVADRLFDFKLSMQTSRGRDDKGIQVANLYRQALHSWLIKHLENLGANE